MPLPKESIYKVLQSDKLVGTKRAVVVVTGDTIRDEIPFGEFFIFHGVPKIPFLYSRSRYSHSDEFTPFDFGQYPEVFGAKAMMDAEHRQATDRLEFELSQGNQALHQGLFWSASPIRFQEVEDNVLAEFHILNLFETELQKMFSFSRSRALGELKSRLNKYPRAIRNIETK